MSFNNISVTQFASKTAGTFLENHSDFLNYAYTGIEEFEMTKKGYAPGDNLTFKIYGYPTVQTGPVVTPQAIVDKAQPYTVLDEDWLNIPYQINLKNMNLQVVGGKLGFMGKPFDNPNDAKSINPEAKTFIDRYGRPAGLAIDAFIGR